MTDDKAVDYTKVPVETLVPHSPPMVLIDEILSYYETGLIAAVDIHEQCRFYSAQARGVPSWAGIEYMAQAISAWAGINAKRQGREIELGFLLGSRKMKLPETVFKSGQRYQVYVRELVRDPSGLASFDCRIAAGEQDCASARVNVYEGSNIRKIIGELE